VQDDDPDPTRPTTTTTFWDLALRQHDELFRPAHGTAILAIQPARGAARPTHVAAAHRTASIHLAMFGRPALTTSSH